MSSENITEVRVPDLGGADNVDVIDIAVAVGDCIEQESTILTVESDKATIEVPSPVAGTVTEVKTAVGSTVSEGDLIFMVATANAASSATSKEPDEKVEGGAEQGGESASSQVNRDVEVNTSSPVKPTESSPDRASTSTPITSGEDAPANVSKQVHAGPAVRRLANELGVDLAQVLGSGPKQRILKEDVHRFVKHTLRAPKSVVASGSGLPELPEIDFSKWGSVEQVELNKIQRSSASNLHRSWVNIPHVTQFDEADITEMNVFRKAESEKLKPEGIKLTPLAFIIKAVAHALMQFPKFKASLSKSGDTLILKQYCHVGFAVDTPNGLVVPVVRDVDTLSVIDIARELQRLSEKARDKKLTPNDMQGGCFTVSSLGGIGGTQFTPIVNWPEVAILGVSKAKLSPVYIGSELQPRLIMPISLSYDHRVIDGADAVRFTTFLSDLLSDIRRILL